MVYVFLGQAGLARTSKDPRSLIGTQDSIDLLRSVRDHLLFVCNHDVQQEIFLQPDTTRSTESL